MKKTFLKTCMVMCLSAVIGASLFAGGQAEAAGADGYPSKEVSCIVIANAGGGTDAMARAVTNPLEKLMGKPFVVINNGSAGGLIAMEDISAADPDGYTLGVFSNTDVANFAYGQADCAFTVDDFTYIAALNTTGDIIVLKKNSQFKSLDDFLAYAKGNPGKATVGLPSPIQEMSLTLFSQATGAELTGVVYGGGNKVFADLLGGHIEAGILSAKFIQQASEQNLTVLGLMLDDRLSSYPDVPTFLELGYEVSNPAKRMLVGPKGMDSAIVAKLVAAMETGYGADMKQNIEAIGEVPELTTGDELAAFLADDFAMRRTYFQSK
ncbi:MAG: tripartite tricarboxylate transporter substrate binding protein [Sphaerochaetaceae bacterium]|nr:tripartite tricarboxylate transporter substrate binding protein [Sphaerochaetaceae bacterium]